MGRLRRANSTSSSYRYLVAYEINAQGWKKRLGLEGVGGGAGEGGGVSGLILVEKMGARVPRGPSPGSATDIDGIITEFARLKSTHLALCL